MRVKNITLSASVLKWARATLFGKRKEDAAKKLKISIEQLYSWEANDPSVSVVIFKRIAKVYKRHPSVMLLKNPPVSQEPPKFRTLPLFENIDFDSKTFLAIRQAQEVQNNTAFLLENRENLIMHNLTKFSKNYKTLSLEVARLIKIEKDTRYKSKTSREQLIFWKRSLEAIGIIVLQNSFPLSDSRAFAIYHKVAPVIVLNSQDSDNARIFSLFHELGHLILRQTDSDPELNLNIKASHGDEYFCNNFAASVLVPEELLREVVGVSKYFDDANVKLIANKFKVSSAVIWRRLYDATLISKDQFDKIAGKLSVFEPYSIQKKGKGGGKNTFLYTTMNRKGEFYISEVFNAYNSKRISYFEVLDYIGIKAKTLPKLQRLMFA